MRRQDPRLNKWLTSTVDTYIKEYGKVGVATIYEVGSRDGNDGVELAQRILDDRLKIQGDDNLDLWTRSDVVLFECNPPQIEVIKGKYPNTTLITEAISNVSGKTVEFLQIHGDQNFVGSSTLNTKRSDNWIKETSTIKVKTKRLDEVIEELGHQNTEIDICKIDIEGYTWEALESLGKYLRNIRVFHLETEVGDYARDKTNTDIALYMEQKGYKCTALEHEWGDTIQDQVWLRV